MELGMEASSCCVCLNSAPILHKIVEKVNDNETLTPIYKLLICVPDIDWLQIHHICNLCKDHLDETYDFREMCFKSEFSRCEIKIEDHQIEILDNDGFGNDLKIETKPSLENTTTFTNVCNICSNIAENLSKISKNSNEENVPPILKLKILIENIIWSDDYDICNLCKERLNKAYDFRDLCFKNQCYDDSLAIESKQIKIETSIESGNECNILRELLENNCTYCKGVFDSKQQLIVHLRSEHPTQLKRSKQSNIYNIFKCKHCSKEFKTKQLFQRHLSVIHKVGELMHKCHICEKRFSLPNQLKRHVRLVHLNICDFKCDQCSKEFKSNKSLQKHLARIHNVGVQKTQRFECHVCSKRFQFPNILLRHLRKEHLNIYDFKCEQCGKEFKLKRMLQKHQAKVHAIVVEERLRHKCHVCSERFLLLNQLKSHIRQVHSDICDFKCDQCSQAFKTKLTLQRHLAVMHKVGELKHKCHICEKRFLLRSDLKIHLHQVHLINRDFNCDQCDKECKSKRMLQGHLARVHKIGVEEALKHKCQHCSKRFSLHSELEKHLRLVHLNVFDFKCELCSKELKSKQALRKHLAKIHEVGVEETLKYKCHLCSKRCFIPHELREHLSRTHSFHEPI